MTQSRAFFITASTLLYALAIVTATLTLNSYFAQTWDVNTFIQAGRQLLGNMPLALYAESRAAQTWPFAYPPLHALVTAIFLRIGDLVPLLPDYVWARVPALLADVGVGFALYALVMRKSGREELARAAFLLWLFNPVTFYNTAVQGHFESEWILFVILAYSAHERTRGVILPTLALATAVLFKQVAILFAIPFWVILLLDALKNRSPKAFLLSLALFGIVTFGVSAPFIFYSADFVYMNLTYVQNVPIQTQSWILLLAGLTRPSPDALTSDFFMIRYSTLVTLFATIALSMLSARRGFSLWLTGALISLVFFLTSKKVMGYYYVMLFPFLFAEFVPRARWGLALGAILLTTWISISPYYAPWATRAHGWYYAALGTLNSVLFVWMFMRMTRDERQTEAKNAAILRPSSDVVRFVSLGLFATAALAALFQPFAPNGGSPIRLPLIVPGAETNVLTAFVVLIALALGGLWMLSRKIGRVPRAAWAIVLVFAPLFFVVYYLTKESTAAFEFLLKTLGV